MKKLENANISITVDDANVYGGEPLLIDIKDDTIVIETKIGKTNIQTLRIKIEKDVYLKMEEEK